MSEPLDRPQRAIMDGKVPCLSVVMPVFNEEATVEKIEPEITAKVARLGVPIYEVAVSYNGRTYAQAKKVDWWGRLQRTPVHLKI